MSRKVSILIYCTALLLGFGCTLASCSKDNESDPEVARLKALLLDDQGQIVFDRTGTDGLYQIGIYSLEDAHSLANIYAGEGFTGQAYTHTLEGNKGTVKVNTGDNGVYYNVSFDVVGIPSFSLDIAEGSQGGNTLSILHECKICGLKWTGTFSRCPRLNDKNYHPN